MTRAALAFALLFSLALGCSDDSPENPATNHSTQMDADMESVSDLPAVGDLPFFGDAAADLPPPCPDGTPETCEEGSRLVNCECLEDIDRACDDDGDCREDETCRVVDEFQICWWEEPEPRVCPGGPGCNIPGDDKIYVGAASKIVTPQGYETATPEGIGDDNYLSVGLNRISDPTYWNDCGYDTLCPGDDGYPGPDRGEGDGIAQGMWISGFGGGRPAQFCPEEKIGCDEPDCCVSRYAHDDIMVQIAVFRRNDVTIAFATLDVTGLFHSDIETIRKGIASEANVDLVIMAATHNHEGPDFQGQWGPGDPVPQQSGVDPVFKELVISKSIEGIEEAVAGLEEAEITATVVDAGIDGLQVSDSRTPFIIDDNLPIVRATSVASGETIATLISWGNHAEILWSQNPYLTADFYGFTRKYIEEGLDAVTDGDGNELKPELPGVGGVTVMFAGAVGGLIYPGKGGAKNYAGEAIPDERRHTFEAADAVGQTLASKVLEAIHNDQMQTLDAPDLRFATQRYLTEIENTVFLLAGFNLRIFERDIYNTTRLGNGFRPELPKVQTQVSVVRLGPVTFFTAPGELFPEMLVGGFPGKPRIQTPIVGDIEERRYPATCDEDGLPTENDDGTHACIIAKDAENPPDWQNAPDGPYGYEIVPGTIPFFIGLGHDHLGYIVPPYDFETEYTSQAPGDHYEETNSAGSEFYTDWRTRFETIVELVE